jgi:hypothetical protein
MLASLKFKERLFPIACETTGFLDAEGDSDASVIGNCQELIQPLHVVLHPRCIFLCRPVG